MQFGRWLIRLMRIFTMWGCTFNASHWETLDLSLHTDHTPRACEICYAQFRLTQQYVEQSDCNGATDRRTTRWKRQGSIGGRRRSCSQHLHNMTSTKLCTLSPKVNSTVTFFTDTEGWGRDGWIDVSMLHLHVLFLSIRQEPMVLMPKSSFPVLRSNFECPQYKCPIQRLQYVNHTNE